MENNNYMIFEVCYKKELFAEIKYDSSSGLMTMYSHTANEDKNISNDGIFFVQCITKTCIESSYTMLHKQIELGMILDKPDDYFIKLLITPSSTKFDFSYEFSNDWSIVIYVSKHAFIINGSGETGKDTFVDAIIDSASEFVLNISSIDPVRNMLSKNGIYDKTKKNEVDRNFLSDMKRTIDNYCGWTNNFVRGKINTFYDMAVPHNGSSMLFVHIREPENINIIEEEFRLNSLLVTSERVEKIVSNDSDKNVENHNYALILENDGNEKDWRDKANKFKSSLGRRYIGKRDKQGE